MEDCSFKAKQLFRCRNQLPNPSSGERSFHRFGLSTTNHNKFKQKHENHTNYFTSSDPHHDMLGGGCQVRVVIENMMGRMENLKTFISGFLGLVILVRWALVTMFLS